MDSVYKEQLSALLRRVQEVHPRVDPTSSCATFGWKSFLSHLPRAAVVCRGILGDAVMTTGSGPVEEDEFDAFLIECGIETEFVSDGECSVLIIGQRDWNDDELVALLEKYTGDTLRVYSQEMVIASMAMCADVFEVMSPEELEAFGTEHDGLQFLMRDRGFDWPTTEVAPNSLSVTVNFESFDSPETGLLRHMGYQVGKSSPLNQRERREILDHILRIEIHPASDPDRVFADQWSKPMSAARLQKAANCIASFARLRKLDTHRDNSVAIADWEADLGYLHDRYYVKLSSSFRWPETKVG